MEGAQIWGCHYIVIEGHLKKKVLPLSPVSWPNLRDYGAWTTGTLGSAGPSYTRGVVPWGAGVPWHPQILADQLTLSQLGGTDYAHLITAGSPGFSDLPTALYTVCSRMD